MKLPASVDETISRLAEGDYVAERSLATAVFLTTEIARVLGRRFVRLQCYEGLDVASAVYEWNYPRQRWPGGTTKPGRRPRYGGWGHVDRIC